MRCGPRTGQARAVQSMVTAKQLKKAILARRMSKGLRRKRARPETVADLERARERAPTAYPGGCVRRDLPILCCWTATGFDGLQCITH